MTAPIVYKNTDASAPALTGQTDTLNVLLLAVLVNGYGAKAAAGWTRPYYDAATDTGSYRPAAGPRHYLQVADGGPGAGSFREARLRGYVAMTTALVGTEPFPTVAQMTNGMFARKSATLDGTPRNWIAIADDSTLYLFIDSADSSTGYQLYTFGRFRSWRLTDAYESLLTARIVENSALVTTTQSPQNFYGTINAGNTVGYAARSYNGLSGGVPITQKINAALNANSTEAVLGSNGQTYPYPVDGGLLISPLYINEGSLPRGEFRGLWIPCHPRPILQGDTFTATDGATSRTMQATNLLSSGQIFFETTDTWDTV